MGCKHGEVHWSELMTRDPEGAKAFYAKVCGWTFDVMPMPMGFDYIIAMTPDGPACGIMPMSEEMAKTANEGWHTYIAVDDVDAAAKRAASAGGTLTGDPFDVPEVGRIAIVLDPSGSVIGLITPVERPEAA